MFSYQLVKVERLALSPAEKKLYIDDSERRRIRVFNVKNDRSLSGDTVFHDMNIAIPGSPDGMKVDVEGEFTVPEPEAFGFLTAMASTWALS